MTNTIDRGMIEDALQDLGYDGIRDDYSGRGMYGRECWGLTGRFDAGDVRRALERHVEQLEEDISSDENDLDWEAEEEFIEKVERMVRDVSQDSMGMDAIVYFPGWKLIDWSSLSIAAPGLRIRGRLRCWTSCGSLWL